VCSGRRSFWTRLLREQLLREGANPAALTPAEFAEFVRQDIERWAPVVRSSGAKPD